MGGRWSLHCGGLPYSMCIDGQHVAYYAFPKSGLLAVARGCMCSVSDCVFSPAVGIFCLASFAYRCSHVLPCCYVCSEGGLFRARLSFPADYPFMPPTMKFETYMWHPNVYKDGRVCISILHPPGNDPAQYELASERWSPVHTVETILLSVISMLASPNDESAANLDAAKEWRDTPDVFKRKVRDAVRRAQEDWG